MGAGHLAQNFSFNTSLFRGQAKATEPYLAMLVEKGIEKALAENKGLAAGVNTRDGHITCDAVAKALGY